MQLRRHALKHQVITSPYRQAHDPPLLLLLLLPCL
jgi:hypothetical protein